MRRWGGWTGRDSGQPWLWRSGAGVVGPGGGSAQGQLAPAACWLTVTSVCLALCGWHSDPKITRHHCDQQKSDNTREGRRRTPRGIGSAIRGEGSRALGLNHPFPPLWIGGGSAPPLTPSWSGRINGEGRTGWAMATGTSQGKHPNQAHTPRCHCAASR